MFEKIPERFLRQAVLIERDGGRVSDDDLRWLQGEMHEDWRAHWERIWESGDPTASVQNFSELLEPVPIADQTAVPGTSEAVLWAAMFASLPANFFQKPGKTCRIRAFGVMTTGGTPGTLTLTPRFGTTTGGTSLGAGTVSGTLASNQTGVPWFLDATCICRSIGSSGSLAFFGVWESPRGYTAAPGSVECGNGSVATIDTTSASGGLTVGATLSQAGSSLTTRKLAIESLN